MKKLLSKQRGATLFGKVAGCIIIVLLVAVSGLIGFKVGRTAYAKSNIIPIDSGIEVRTDVDGDGVVERVRVTDNVSGDYAFTQVGVIFSNGDWTHINFDEDFYSSELTVGDLSGNGAADIVVMKYSIGSTFGAGDVSVLHIVDGNLQEYPYDFIKNPSLAIEQPDNFKDWWVACIGATIIERNGKTLLRLLIAGDEKESAMCIDCSYQEKGWYIENAEMFYDIYATGVYDELLEYKNTSSEDYVQNDDAKTTDIQNPNNDILIEDFWKEAKVDNNDLKFVTGLEIIFPDSWNGKTVYSVDAGPVNDPISTTFIVSEKTNAEMDGSGVVFYLHLFLHEEGEIQYIYGTDKVLGVYEQGDKEYVLILATPHELPYVEDNEECKAAYEELSSTFDSVIIKTDDMIGFTQYDTDDLEWVEYQ